MIKIFSSINAFKFWLSKFSFITGRLNRVKIYYHRLASKHVVLLAIFFGSLLLSILLLTKSSKVAELEVSEPKTALEIYTSIILKKQNARAYRSIKTPKIQDTYVDSVLLTSNYLTTIFSKKFNSEWTIALHKLFTKEFDLSDRTVVKVLPLERNFIRKLQKTTSILTKKNAVIGMDKLRREERKFVNELRNILEGSENVNEFLKFRKIFYAKTLQW
ncbi:hypothetical protein OAB57_00215 [Bacteriovoracaceae bacterium]|nr:hypothetical protein [Bacteriovoracaceae bacterium]